MVKKIDMLPGARKLIRVCAGVKPGEKVLIVTDTGRNQSIAGVVYQAAAEAGAEVVKIVMEPGARPGDEVPDPVAAAMMESEVIIGLTGSSIYHTRARLAACENGSRLAAVTEVTPEMLVWGGIEADFEAQRPITRDLARKISTARRIRLTTPQGTDLSARIGGRAGMEFSSLALQKGEAVGVPDIEVAVSPLEGTGQGTVVVDASATHLGLIKEPIRIDIRDGRAVGIEGGLEARRLKRLIEKQEDDNCWNLAEMAIGLNPCSRVIGKIIEDEGTLGTCHVALGKNTTLGGVTEAKLHLDLVMWRPTLYLDDREAFKAEPVTEP